MQWYRPYDETELRAFFVANTALSLFILCLLFFRGIEKEKRDSNGDKKNHGVPFHQPVQMCMCVFVPSMISVTPRHAYIY